MKGLPAILFSLFLTILYPLLGDSSSGDLSQFIQGADSSGLLTTELPEKNPTNFGIQIDESLTLETSATITEASKKKTEKESFFAQTSERMIIEAQAAASELESGHTEASSNEEFKRYLLAATIAGFMFIFCFAASVVFKAAQKFNFPTIGLAVISLFIGLGSGFLFLTA